MSDDQAILVDVIGRGISIDIMPRILEVIASCRWEHDFSPLDVAWLVTQTLGGKYIPVDVQDRIEGRHIHALVGPVIKHFQSLHRIGQIRELIEAGGEGYFIPKLSVTETCCREARALSGRALKATDLAPLPLSGCDQYVCHCDYSTERLKRIRR